LYGKGLGLTSTDGITIRSLFGKAGADMIPMLSTSPDIKTIRNLGHLVVGASGDEAVSTSPDSKTIRNFPSGEPKSSSR
jgi:hypothetical protein